MAAPKTRLEHVNIEDIHEPDEGLRKVDRTTEEYLGLVASIRKRGLMNPISIREIEDPETNKMIYGLVDGLQRLTACKDAGLEEMPCHIISVADGELLEAQIMGNVHKIETKPVEYSKALLSILSISVIRVGTPTLLTKNSNLSIAVRATSSMSLPVIGMPRTPTAN